MSGQAVVLLSGGLDSGTALAMWLERGGAVERCLCADYGQRAARAEAAASERLARRFGLRWQHIELPWLGEASCRMGSALADGGARAVPERDESAPGDAQSAAAVWVPARNVVLIAAAAAFADATGAGFVVTGFNREEAATFADNSASFCHAFDAVLAQGTRAGVAVASPTLELDKRGIVQQARRLGLGRGDFWSCYHAESDPAVCRCESCVRSRLAWSTA